MNKRLPINPDLLVSSMKKQDDTKSTITVSRSELEKITRFTKDKTGQQDDLFMLFPDIDFVMDAVTTSIISPEDAVSRTLNHASDFKAFNADLKQELIRLTKDHIEEHYKIKDNLFKEVKEALFFKGMYVRMIVPSNIQEFLTEFNTRPGLEEVTFDGFDLETEKSKRKPKNETFLGTNITNNISPLLTKTDKVVPGLEESGSTNLNDFNDVERVLKRLENVKAIDFLSLDTIHTENIPTDTPLRIKIPADSFVPVTLPNDNETWIGGFVLLDTNGNFITDKTGYDDILDEAGLVSKLANDNSIMERVKKELSRTMIKEPKISSETLKSLVDNKLDETLLSIMREENVVLKDTSRLEHVRLIMFNRILKNQKTTVIYVPNEHLESLVYNYRKNGTGESLLERVSVLTSIRSIILFSRLNAQVKNSIPTVKVTLKIDDQDPDPETTRDTMIEEFLRNRPMELPIGIRTVNDLSDWLHSMGFYFKTENKKLPDISYEFDETTRDIKLPDDSLDEELRDRIVMSFGAVPELINGSKDIQFATEMIFKNAMATLRAKERQEATNKMLTENVRKLLSVDGLYLFKLEELIKTRIPKIKSLFRKIEKKNYPDKLIIETVKKKFINSYRIYLPEIKTLEDDRAKNDVKDKADELDYVLDFYISDEFMTEEMVGELGVNAEALKKIIKASIMRDYIASIGYMPELSNIVSTAITGESTFNPLIDNNIYLKQLTEALKKPLKELKGISTKSNRIFEKFEEEVEEEENSDSQSENDNNEDEGQENEPESDDGGDDLGF